jgi:hypothetical protein
MNGRFASAPPPTPGPFCAVYSPLLPLLDARALPPEQEASLREHLADCAWCQNQLAAYAVVEEALRRHYASTPSVQPLTLEDIMRASQSERRFDPQPNETSRATNRQAPRTAGLPDLPKPPGSSRGAGRNRGRPRPWATLGAVAAAMLLVVLAAALFAELRLRTPGGAPAASCATTLQGAAPAAAIPGFTDVIFPAGAVMTTVKSSPGGPSQFTMLETDVCYSGVADDLTGSVSRRHSVTANLLGAGWGVSQSFPYQGALLQPCSSQCYQTGNTRYLALEQITDRGDGVFTYHLRLATPPPAPTCNANFANSPLQGVQTSVEDVSLPPITYAVPDNAAGLRGYDLCSSGTAASIIAFLTNALPSTGWTKVASNARCFYNDQCWTRDLAVISWHVDDPTDWLIAYHPATS